MWKCGISRRRLCGGRWVNKKCINLFVIFKKILSIQFLMDVDVRRIKNSAIIDTGEDVIIITKKIEPYEIFDNKKQQAKKILRLVGTNFKK